MTSPSLSTGELLTRSTARSGPSSPLPYVQAHLAARLALTHVPEYDAKRAYASASEPDLKETLKKVIPAKRELLKKVKAHADKKIGDVKIENTLGGMRCNAVFLIFGRPY